MVLPALKRYKREILRGRGSKSEEAFYEVVDGGQSIGGAGEDGGRGRRCRDATDITEEHL